MAIQAMDSYQVACVIEGLLPTIGGVFATLLGHRKIGKKPGEDPRYDEKVAQVLPTLKVLGPIIFLFGLYLMSRGFF